MAYSTFIDLVWGLDGELGTGDTDLTGSCLKIAKHLRDTVFSTMEGMTLRDELVSLLDENSSGGAITINGGVAGVYYSSAHDELIAWWSDGAESRWKSLHECDDGERELVGADRFDG